MRTTTCFHYGPERGSMLSPFGHPAHDAASDADASPRRTLMTCARRPATERGGIMPERFVTEDDERKLRTLLVGVRERSVRDREHLQQLDDELDRAHINEAENARRCCWRTRRRSHRRVGARPPKRANRDRDAWSITTVRRNRDDDRRSTSRYSARAARWGGEEF